MAFLCSEDVALKEGKERVDLPRGMKHTSSEPAIWATRQIEYQ